MTVAEGVFVGLSPTLQLAALQEADRAECEASCQTFVERHGMLVTPLGEVIRFRLWAAQRRALRAMECGRIVVVLKARRLGLSWLALHYAVWLAIFRPGVRVVMLCKNEDDAKAMVTRVRLIVERLRADPASAHLLGPAVRVTLVDDVPTAAEWDAAIETGADNTANLELVHPDGRVSSFRALPATPRAARSETAGLVLIDEHAFMDKADDVWQAVLPTIEGGGQVVAISTGNGDHGQGASYAGLWSRVSSGAITGATAVFIPWRARPGRDDAWYEQERQAIGDDDRMRAEYPDTPADAFVRPGVTLVYTRQGIDAAVARGAELDALRAGPHGADVFPPDACALGIDWGEQTHVLFGWPLDGGGVYIAAEVVQAHTDPADTARAVLALSPAIAGIRVPRVARFDAAGIQSMRTFGGVVGRDTKRLSIPFAKFKREALGYVRMILRRGAEGHATRVLAVSPSCVVLVRQMRALQLRDDDADAVEKGDDHGPDALLAFVAPIAARMRKLLADEAETREAA